MCVYVQIHMCFAHIYTCCVGFMFDLFMCMDRLFDKWIEKWIHKYISTLRMRIHIYIYTHTHTYIYIYLCVCI